MDLPPGVGRQGAAGSFLRLYRPPRTHRKQSWRSAGLPRNSNENVNVVCPYNAFAASPSGLPYDGHHRFFNVPPARHISHTLCSAGC